jgi:metal-responsive CopG/Arc/MetJ family transcriptional regulator
MSKTKGKWSGLSLPSALVDRMRRVLPYTGNQSLSEYVRFAIQERLRNDEALADEARELEKEIKERLQ